MNTETPVSVTDAQIYNLLCSAAYGAISYWANWLGRTLPTEPHPDPEITGFESLPLRPGGAWKIRSDRHGADGQRTDVLDRDAITRGLATMARIAPRHFSDILTENDDAVTADVFVQCCLFGEIVYG